MQHLLRTGCILAALLLAGCVGGGDSAGDPRMEAPRWQVGDWWVHRSLGVGQGSPDLVRTEVVAVDVVHGRELYRVRVSGNFTDSPQEAYYTRDLDRAWHKWGSACGELPGGEGRPCESGERMFEWPLREGATWEFFEGGDDIEGGMAKATRANRGPADGGPSYVVTFEDRLPTGLLSRLVILSPHVGWYTMNADYDDRGQVVGLSVLLETNYEKRDGAAR